MVEVLRVCVFDAVCGPQPLKRLAAAVSAIVGGRKVIQLLDCTEFQDIQLQPQKQTGRHLVPCMAGIGDPKGMMLLTQRTRTALTAIWSMWGATRPKYSC